MLPCTCDLYYNRSVFSQSRIFLCLLKLSAGNGFWKVHECVPYVSDLQHFYSKDSE